MIGSGPIGTDRSAIAEDGYVTARSEVDKNRIVLTERFVVFLQLASQPASLTADDRVLARTIGRRPIVHLCADHILFESIAFAVQGRFDSEAEKSTEPVRLEKQRVFQNPKKFVANPFFGNGISVFAHADICRVGVASLMTLLVRMRIVGSSLMVSKRGSCSSQISSASRSS